MRSPQSIARRCFCLFLLATVLSGQATAAPEISQISLQLAVQRTLEKNPTLQTLGYQFRAQKGQLQQAGLAPNPELGLVVENAFGGGDLGALDSAETTLSLTWVLERGKRDARLAKGNASVSLIETEAKIQRREVATETARRFLTSLAFQTRKTQAIEAVSIAENTVTQITKRVEAGQAPGADLARAQAALARAKLRLEDFEHEQQTSNHQLASQWGDRTPDFTGVAGDVLSLPRLATFAELTQTLKNSPDLERYTTMARLRDAELRLAQTNAKPNWRVNVGVRHLEQFGEQALVAGITVPLPTRNQNQGHISTARANRERVAIDQAATELEIETQLFSLHQALEHALHTTRTITQKVLPLTKSALADTQRAYNAGRYDYFQLQQVQNELLDTRLAQIEAAISAHRHAIEIERLTGTKLTQGAQR